MRRGTVWILAALVLPGLARIAHADAVLFTDNFNVPVGVGSTNSANYQFNAAGRQGGTIAPLQYTESPAGAEAHHQVFTSPPHTNLGQPLMLVGDSINNGTSVSPNANFAQVANGANNFTIEFDADPNDPRDSTAAATSWMGVSFGALSQGVAVNGGADHVGVLLRGNGRYEIFDGSTNVTLGGGDGDIVTAGGGQYTHITISVSDLDGNPFDGKGSVLIALSSSSTGVFATYSRPDFSGNDLTFESNTTDANASVSYLDNVSISVTPEPGGMGVGGAVAVVMMMKRKRKC